MWKITEAGQDEGSETITRAGNCGQPVGVIPGRINL